MIIARWVSLLALVSCAGAASAEPVVVGVLPSRPSDTSALRAHVLRLGAAFEGKAAAPLMLGPVVTRADELGAAGRLDEAAALYDVAVEQGARAPLSVEDPVALVHALVTRASIGLARGEEAQAQLLLGRALRWDPTLTLTAEENAPRMRAAWIRALARVTTLTSRDLGADCANLLVARRLDDERAELRRVRDCEPGPSIVMRNDDTDSAVLAALGAPPRAVPKRRPIYKRAWLWATVALAAAAIVGIGVGAWAANRGDDKGWNVTPRF